MQPSDGWIDEDPEEVDRRYREVMTGASIEAIVRARSKKKKLALCVRHITEFYSDHPDLAVIARVLSGEKIERPRDWGDVGVHIGINEIRENENVSFEEAVARYASRANMSESAVKQANTRANKKI
jgi:hypothetical protein